jgi:hypothetical protein
MRVFENRVTDEVTEGWRKLHNDESHNLFSSLNIIRVISPRRIEWVRFAACMMKRGMSARI